MELFDEKSSAARPRSSCCAVSCISTLPAAKRHSRHFQVSLFISGSPPAVADPVNVASANDLAWIHGQRILAAGVPFPNRRAERPVSVGGWAQVFEGYGEFQRSPRW